MSTPDVDRSPGPATQRHAGPESASATSLDSMHIGLYAAEWPPSGTANGVVTYVDIVREALLQRGHRVSVFVGNGRADEFRHVYAVRGSPPRRLLSAVRRRLGWERDPVYRVGGRIAEVVQRVHSIEPLDAFEMEESFGWCSDVIKQVEVPVVVKLHGPAFLSLIDGKSQTAERRARIESEGQALPLADVVVAPSASTLADTVKMYPALERAALVSIPNPVASVADEWVWRADRSSPNELLYVGRFDYRKGGDAMIRAFGRLAATRPALTLTFVGPDVGMSMDGGPVQQFSDYVAAHVPPNVASRIRFLGNQPAPSIQRLRAQSAVTVTTTRWESFGYVVAEAMMQGCPIVGFDVPGVNELVVHGDSGLLAPLDDVEALSAFIARLLDDVDQAAALGACARASIMNRCGVEPVVDRMIEVYRDAAARRQRVR